MKEKMIFVTLFDSRYMTRGLVTYESLRKTTDDFVLYIIAMDDKAYDKLTNCNLDRAVIISLSEFEDEELLRIKSTRTVAEYCWTCAPKSLEYVLMKLGYGKVTYIDADLCFFSNPACLIDELGETGSVLLTEHRFSDYCDMTDGSGKYCVQFMTVKNDRHGMEALMWWKDRCLECCCLDPLNGHCGDQKYLEQFPIKFQGIQELQHLGGGVGPWNVSQYTFFSDSGQVYLRNTATKEVFPLIFYHFHGMAFYDKDVVHLSDSIFRIPDTAISHVYKYYIRFVEEICLKYRLSDEKAWWNHEEHFRDDDLDALDHDKLYFMLSLFY